MVLANAISACRTWLRSSSLPAGSASRAIPQASPMAAIAAHRRVVMQRSLKGAEQYRESRALG
jgi:hypothetical protein